MYTSLASINQYENIRVGKGGVLWIFFSFSSKFFFWGFLIKSLLDQPFVSKGLKVDYSSFVVFCEYIFANLRDREWDFAIVLSYILRKIWHYGAHLVHLIAHLSHKFMGVLWISLVASGFAFIWMKSNVGLCSKKNTDQPKNDEIRDTYPPLHVIEDWLETWFLSISS